MVHGMLCPLRFRDAEKLEESLAKRPRAEDAHQEIKRLEQKRMICLQALLEVEDEIGVKKRNCHHDPQRCIPTGPRDNNEFLYVCRKCGLEL